MADVIQVASAIPLAYWLVAASLVVLLIVVMRSLWVIGPTQVGLVRKRYSRKRLDSGSPVALDGAAGYQAELLTAGLRFKLWPLYTVTRHPLVQIPAGQSMEGFVFMIDLQVQIHVPDSDAPRVISTVGTMSNLVNEVLQAAVGNHFRDKLQGMPAIDFIQKRADVQAQAQEHISERLRVYRVETRGVYIQDVVFPAQLVEVLTAREIANQQKARYDAERTAQDQRLLLEASRGKADQQSALAQSMVGVDIARNKASAVQAEADGEAYRLTKVGEASAVQTRAEGLAVAVGLEAQQQAVGAAQAAMINVAKALAERHPALHAGESRDHQRGRR